MRFLKRISVLLNEETAERFDREDIVKITTVGTFSREIIGRIDYIDSLEMIIDKSEKYKNLTEKIKYEDIAKIEKIQ
jgi:hypothetical protein